MESFPVGRICQWEKEKKKRQTGNSIYQENSKMHFFYLLFPKYLSTQISMIFRKIYSFSFSKYKTYSIIHLRNKEFPFKIRKQNKKKTKSGLTAQRNVGANESIKIWDGRHSYNDCGHAATDRFSKG